MNKEVENLKTIAISKHGGARKNSGRKPKLKYEARELFNLAVDQRWPLILEKIDELILKGDKDMIKMLIEQRIGRSPVAVSFNKFENKQTNFNLVLNPEMMEKTKAFEDEIKKLIYKSATQDN